LKQANRSIQILQLALAHVEQREPRLFLFIR